MPEAVALAACGVGTLLIVLGVRSTRAGRETLGFTRTRGVVVDSRVEEIPGPAEHGGDRFEPVIRYRFEARGHGYESERVSLEWPAGATSPDAQEARSLVERHPAGSAVDVWFDPADPRSAVLVRGGAPAQVTVAIVVGLGLIAVGLLVLARAQGGP